MAAPDNRVPVRVARGSKATLVANIADLYEGEICYATDENVCYVKEGATLEPASGGATQLSELSDIDLTTPPTDGQLLVWSAVDSSFLPGDAANPVVSIDDLSDVDTSTVAPTDGQVLTWDNANSQWEPATPTTPSTATSWSVTADGTDNYIFAGDGFAGTETDPVLSVVRGQTYEITNLLGAHPFQIQSVAGLGGAAYSDGITGNAVSNGTLTWEVRMDAPAELYYQCTSHADMGGTIQVLENAAGGGGAGATALSELSDTAGLPVISNTQKLLGRWLEGLAEDDDFRPGAGKWKNTSNRIYFATTDADGQDVTAAIATTVSTDKLQIATDSDFTNLVYDDTLGDQGAVSDTGNGPHYRFNGNPSIIGIAGSGEIWMRVFTQTVAPTVDDSKVLMWDQSAVKWVPGTVLIPEKSIEELTDVSPDLSVSLLNFDYAAGTGENYAPITDEVASSADGFQWMGDFDYQKVVASPVKFGIGAYELLTGVLRFPNKDAGEHTQNNYDAWSTRWALGDSDFTMEFWWYFPSGQNTADRTFVCWGDSVSHSAIKWTYMSDGVTDFEVRYTPDGTSVDNVATFNLGSAIAEDVWTHVAICRDGANLRAFVNGTQVGGDHNIGSTVIKTPSYSFTRSQFRLGGDTSSSTNSRGHIDGWSYTKEAKYTATFTLPAAAPEASVIPDGSILVYNSGLWQSSTDYISTTTLKAAVNDGAADFAAFQAYINNL